MVSGRTAINLKFGDRPWRGRLLFGCHLGDLSARIFQPDASDVPRPRSTDSRPSGRVNSRRTLRTGAYRRNRQQLKSSRDCNLPTTSSSRQSPNPNPNSRRSLPSQSLNQGRSQSRNLRTLCILCILCRRSLRQRSLRQRSLQYQRGRRSLRIRDRSRSRRSLRDQRQALSRIGACRHSPCRRRRTSPS